MSQKYLNLYKKLIELAMANYIQISEEVETYQGNAEISEQQEYVARLEKIINKIEYRLLNGYRK